MDLEKIAVSTKPSKNRLSSLDGLRGWAALTVVLGHLTRDITPFNYLQLTPLTDTKLAVGVFFVISGFVLSYRFIGHRMELSTLFKAFIARYARLTIPIAAVSLLVLFFGFHLSLLHNVDASRLEPKWGLEPFYLFKSSLTDALKFSFWDVYVHYDNTHTYIPPSWTMVVELRGSYFIYAIVFFVGLHNYWSHRRLALIMIAALALLVYTRSSSFFLFPITKRHANLMSI